MKFIMSSLLIGLIVLSCKKESKTEISTTDSIVTNTVRTDTISTVTPLPSDTIRIDTVSSKNKMDTVRSHKNTTTKK
ncbi:hypothetical protein SAMN06265171_101925 [Chryseobacterium rhizoplanae]|uniref:Uncharacterized protein n=1 Tax=Chryseobacterium rhizoplanae TaxID=1609531 RepID=A0A521BDB3_9FLAO|nr:hypothetical protein [Chryseobacterium rhizoplanae]SMO45095.1 hypothetical protein SAMN06265171_101925 [Chryseobacterium rhizoplanae]